MHFWIYILISELIPLGLFIIGGLYESNSTRYEEMKFGYKNQYSIKDKFSWEYSNKLAAKIFGSIGSLLFIVNAIILFIFGVGTFTFVLLFSLFMVILSRMMVDKIIKKKFDNK
ncbi:SdpI family protein [Clostridium sp. AL.422]|uniref:SdpI family protein n=1 Tax=Clostridium TaxID=1485 RepID=UPI00293DBCE1|nr:MULTISPECIES: SdpI family protein [unclassified Clostridium]MDV4150183.1 SdpI family protein [Clostridium sp. AL.422]